MYRLSFCRPALVLALLLLVVAPWEAAAGPRFGGAQSRAAFSDSATPDLFSGFLSFLSKLWSKAGCILDPNGQCIPEKAGCGIDPHGQCAPTQVENGCTIDPHGGCVSG
jgi:hypothetical protein